MRRPCAPAAARGCVSQAYLPNYGVFDEQRWFVPGDEPPALFGVAGWVVDREDTATIVRAAQAGRAGYVVVNLNASPYNRGRRHDRIDMLRERLPRPGAPSRT